MTREGATGQALIVRSTRARHRLDKPGSIYALKVLTKENARLFDKTDPTNKDIERSVLTKLPWNPFVAGVLQTFVDELNLYTMLEFIPCGSLRGLLQSHGPFDSTSSTFYFSNIAVGIEFLEAHNVYHRDLKPENILVAADGYLVLADFGEGAHEHDYANTKWIQVGSPAYSAPELMSSSLDEEKTIFSGVDWWSAGIILYEMTYRKLPWWGKNEVDIHRKKTSGSLNWRHRIKVGERLKSLISGLLTVDTTTRVGANGAQEVMSHEWLRQVKWSKIKGRAYLAPYVPPMRFDVEETWHKVPLPLKKTLPGLGKVVGPPSHLNYNDCFPKSTVEDDDPEEPYPCT
ncbi:hypothetical protein DXG01_000352 [Tephrocybe rancida]|nr:hypothetical protein DXG01_000352 [Tephrocybe rancida]